jgi:hypothetical protein
MNHNGDTKAATEGWKRRCAFDRARNPEQLQKSLRTVRAAFALGLIDPDDVQGDVVRGER